MTQKTIRISYDPDLSLIGTTRTVDAEEARSLVRQGLAVVVEPVAELVDKPKADLVSKAESLGVDVKASATKKDIAKAIHGAESSG